MIQVVAKQHDEGRLAGKWDLYVHDGSEDGDLLVFSNQGYENRDFVEHIAERLFPDVEPGALGVEPVDLVVKRADGTGSHRMLR